MNSRFETIAFEPKQGPSSAEEAHLQMSRYLSSFQQAKESLCSRGLVDEFLFGVPGRRTRLGPPPWRVMEVESPMFPDPRRSMDGSVLLRRLRTYARPPPAGVSLGASRAEASCVVV